MSRLWWVAPAIIAVGVVAWWLTRESPRSAPEPAPAPAVAPAAEPTAPPPAPVDAAVPPAPPPLPPTPADAMQAERVGLLGLAPDQIEVLLPRGWSRVDGELPGWRSPDGTEVTFEVRDGRVHAARAQFSPTAFSSAASELTVPLIGVGAGGGPMLPGGEQAESMTADATPRTGELTRDWGPTLYWRLTLRSEGDPPYGPQLLEVRATAFGAREAHSTP